MFPKNDDGLHFSFSLSLFLTHAFAAVFLFVLCPVVQLCYPPASKSTQFRESVMSHDAEQRWAEQG